MESGSEYMTFEQNLNTELSSISGLKVFPNFAYEDESPPFCVYRKLEGKYLKTLDLPPIVFFDGEYEFLIASTNYSSLQTNLFAVKSKLLSFCGRTVGGTGGIFVQDVTIVSINESYDSATKTHYAEIECKIFFKE